MRQGFDIYSTRIRRRINKNLTTSQRRRILVESLSNPCRIRVESVSNPHRFLVDSTRIRQGFRRLIDQDSMRIRQGFDKDSMS